MHSRGFYPVNFMPVAALLKLFQNHWEPKSDRLDLISFTRGHAHACFNCPCITLKFASRNARGWERFNKFRKICRGFKMVWKRARKLKFFLGKAVARNSRKPIAYNEGVLKFVHFALARFQTLWLWWFGRGISSQYNDYAYTTDIISLWILKFFEIGFYEIVSCRFTEKKFLQAPNYPTLGRSLCIRTR